MKNIFALLLLCLCAPSWAQLSVTGTFTKATCLSNGSVQVHTTGGSAPFSFVLLNAANVVIKPGQKDSLFENLPAGSYKVAVYDSVNAAIPVVSALGSITASYLSMSVVGVSGSVAPLPYACAASSNAGNLYVTFSNGVAPFTISILSGATMAAPIVTSSRNATFTGLATGTYIVAITDACGSTISTGSIPVYGSSLAYPASILSLSNTVSFSSSSKGACGPQVYYNASNSGLPIRWYLEYPAGSGNYTDTFPRSDYYQLPYIDPVLLAGRGYKLWVEHPCTKVWQSSGTQPLPDLRPLSPSVDANSSLYVTNNCDSIMPRIQTGFSAVPGNSARLFYCYPIHITIVDSLNPAVKVLDTMLTQGATLYPASFPVPYSGTYVLQFTDGQNSTYQKSITVFAQAPRRVSVQPQTFFDCDASKLGLSLYGIAPGNIFPVTINLISAAGVSNPAVYSPIVVNKTTYTNDIIQLWNNIPAANGTLKYEVVFNCRRDTISVSTGKFKYKAAKLDSFSVHVGSLGCSGGKADVWLNAHLTDTAGTNTTVLYNSTASNPFLVRILPNGTNNYLGNANAMVFQNLAPGTYKIGIAPNIANFNAPPASCPYWDTITVVVPAFTAPAIDANKTFGMVCTDDTTGQLRVEATGYTPFQYRMKPAGGATYSAWQSSNLFNALPAGNYNVQVMDGCNAISTQVVGVIPASSGAFISTSGITGTMASLGGAVQLRFTSLGASSATIWTRPDGSTVSGDVLNIAHFTNADSGLYSVRAISATGCMLRASVALRMAVPLPLQLLTFSGKAAGNNDVLEWQVATETPGTYYSVEYSEDGSHFKSVGRVAARNQADDMRYQFTSPGNGGIAYYRLQVAEPSGKSYSHIVTVHRDEAARSISCNNIFPVPFADQLHFNISSEQELAADVVLRDITGREVLKTQMKLTAGSQDYVLGGLGSLERGTYLLCIKAGTESAIVGKVTK